MKSFIVTLTFLFTVCICTVSQAQSQQQTNVELKDASTPAINSNSQSVDVVPTDESAILKEGNSMNIEGRKVNVDSQGVQSLSVPDAKPVQNTEIKKPD